LLEIQLKTVLLGLFNQLHELSKSQSSSLIDSGVVIVVDDCVVVVCGFNSNAINGTPAHREAPDKKFISSTPFI
jgi:hypothetical protein